MPISLMRMLYAQWTNDGDNRRLCAGLHRLAELLSAHMNDGPVAIAAPNKPPGLPHTRLMGQSLQGAGL